MEILKKKLRPGQSYPVKSSALAALIEERRVSATITLRMVSERWWTEGVLLRADFYPPGRVPGFPPGIAPDLKESNTETLHITCRSVPSTERQAARTFLETFVLPALADWILSIERLPPNSTVRREKQSFTRSWTSPASTAEVR